MATLRESLTYQPAELTFGTSGLRGLVTDMTDLECYINTRGFLTFVAAFEPAQTTIYVAGDLRNSTPRILAAVLQAVRDSGYEAEYCGLIPTPAVAAYALSKQSPCIMVTGSHIPDDRNGIKFYKADGEVLKNDEVAIKAAVAEVRGELYGQDEESSAFNNAGMSKSPIPVPTADLAAREYYRQRYLSVFDGDAFAGRKIVFYQHSAVGRDLLPEILRALGAEVVPVGRSEKFISIDTENVTPADQAYFRQIATEHPDAFAIVSTDGDSDRPFVIDHEGTFHRGDVLGAVVADWLHADAAAAPISVSDAVDQHLQGRMTFTHTRIGSPYVVSAMYEAAAEGKERVVGWEVNGGFMTGCDLQIDGRLLPALPTRDALLPIIGALMEAIEDDDSVAELFAKLPQRFTGAGMINNFPVDVSRQIVARFAEDTADTYAALAQFFTAAHGFGAVIKINNLDGVRIFFDNGEIAHLRPSGNAPQLRCYSVAATQERADEIVALAIVEPSGVFRSMESQLTLSAQE